jgi:hypothetical protein
MQVYLAKRQLIPLPASHPGSCLLYFCLLILNFISTLHQAVLRNLTGLGIIRQKHMIGGEAFDTPLQVFVLSQ